MMTMVMITSINTSISLITYSTDISFLVGGKYMGNKWQCRHSEGSLYVMQYATDMVQLEKSTVSLKS